MLVVAVLLVTAHTIATRISTVTSSTATTSMLHHRAWGVGRRVGGPSTYAPRPTPCLARTPRSGAPAHSAPRALRALAPAPRACFRARQAARCRPTGRAPAPQPPDEPARAGRTAPRRPCAACEGRRG